MFSSGRSGFGLGFGRGLALVAGIMTATAAAASEPGHYGYGTTATPAQMAGWDIDVRGDDGFGLPPGKGSVERGAVVFADQCAACHGTFGEGEGRYPKLAGGTGTLRDDRPEPTVGSYWPFASTLFDYINRAMPFPTPHSLSSDDVYALTAYILNLNDVVQSDFVANRVSLPEVKMPNRENFTWTDPRPDTNAQPCMSACVNPADVKITSTAEGRNLTPHTIGPLDTMQSQ
jgi:mono/diheme cytochrome c family protein